MVSRTKVELARKWAERGYTPEECAPLLGMSRAEFLAIISSPDDTPAPADSTSEQGELF